MLRKHTFKWRKAHKNIVYQLSDHCVWFLVSFSLKCGLFFLKKGFGGVFSWVWWFGILGGLFGFICGGVCVVVVFFVWQRICLFVLRKIREPWCVNSVFSLLGHVFDSSDLTAMFLICGSLDSLCISAPSCTYMQCAGFDWQISTYKKIFMKWLCCKVLFSSSFLPFVDDFLIFLTYVVFTFVLMPDIWCLCL